jgi:AraC-like DNA-binding protein
MPIVLFEHIINQQLKKLAPAKAVRDYIDSYYILTPAAWGHVCLAFNDGVPMMAILHDPKAKVILGSKMITGGWLSTEVLEKVTIEPVNNSGPILIVRFNPANFYQLGISEYPDWAVADIKVIEERILQLAAEKPYPNYLFEQAMTLLREEKGAMPIQAVLAHLKVNYKWLERSFNKHIGLSPKAYARLQRFINAYAALIKSEGRDLTAVALDNGYYDQTHFIKEFQRITGVAPLRYLAKSPK